MRASDDDLEAADGVIKFHYDSVETELTETAALTELCQIRDRLWSLALVGTYPDGVGYGNLSIRGPEPSFFITGTQTGNLPHLSVTECVRVDAYDVKRNWLRCTGGVAPSSEALTHGALYALHPSIAAVVHVHHAALWREHLGKLPTTDAAVPYGTAQMAEEMHRVLSSVDLQAPGVLVMAGHQDGLIAFGSTLNAAASCIEQLLRA